MDVTNGKDFAIKVLAKVAKETIFTEDEAGKLMKACSPRYVLQAARIVNDHAAKKELLYFLAVGSMATLQRNKSALPSVKTAWGELGITISHPAVLRGIVAGTRLLH